MFTFKKQKMELSSFLVYIYVDDSMIVSPNLAYLEQSKVELANEFAMINSGDLSFKQIHFGYPHMI
jgi:hypothetical protein